MSSRVEKERLGFHRALKTEFQLDFFFLNMKQNHLFFTANVQSLNFGYPADLFCCSLPAQGLLLLCLPKSQMTQLEPLTGTTWPTAHPECSDTCKEGRIMKVNSCLSYDYKSM